MAKGGKKRSKRAKAKPRRLASPFKDGDYVLVGGDPAVVSEVYYDDAAKTNILHATEAVEDYDPREGGRSTYTIELFQTARGWEYDDGREADIEIDEAAYEEPRAYEYNRGKKRKANTHDPREASREFDKSMELVEQWIGQAHEMIEDGNARRAVYAFGEAQYFLGCADGHLQYASPTEIDRNLKCRYDQYQQERKWWAQDLINRLEEQGG